MEGTMDLTGLTEEQLVEKHDELIEKLCAEGCYYVDRAEDGGFRLAFSYGENSGGTFGRAFRLEREAQKVADELNSYTREILEQFCNLLE
jgi:hypothetical protein